MTARDMREPAHGTERRAVDGRSAGDAASSVEEAAIGYLALTLWRVAARRGQSPEDLLAAVPDAELAALYRTCARKACGADQTSMRQRTPSRVEDG